MVMKIFKLFLSAAMVVSLAAGCARELEPAHAELDKSVSYIATLDETPTKTVLDYEKKLSLWTGDEYISVLNGQENYTFMSTSQEPSATATFFLADDKEYIPSEVVAMYPCRAEYSLDKESMTVSGVYVPTSQIMDSETYDVNASILMAYAGGSELKFKNAMSLIRFKVKDSGVYRVTLKSNGGEAMTGNYNLEWNGGSPRFAVAEAVDSVNLYTNGDFVPGKYYYAAVVPGSYSQGFTVSMNTGGESRVISEAKTLERNTIYDLGELALPTGNSWGIAGTMNNWGEIPDFEFVEEDGVLVYKNLPISIMDRFKFRADNEWVNERSFGGVVSAGNVYVFEDGVRGDMFLWEPAVYNVYLAKNLESCKFVKVGDLDGKPAPKNWGVVGTMTGWGSSAPDYTMTTEGNIYVARNVPIRASDLFKFRVDSAWDYDLGLLVAEGVEPAPVASMYPAPLAVGGHNILVAESGIYDIFLSCYEDGFRIMKVGDLEDEPQPDPTPDPTPDPATTTVYFKPASSWKTGEVTFAAWLWSTGEGAWYDMTDSDSDEIYEVTFPTELNMIIFASMSGTNDWNNKKQQTSDLSVPTDAKNVYVAYANEWMTLADAKAFQEPAPDPDKSSWYLVGSFNGWNPASADYQMSLTNDGWHVFENLTLSSASEVKFAEGGWGVNRGGAWVGIDEPMSLSQDGANINVPAGTYDVYMNKELNKAYFCTSGSKPY